MFFNRGILHSRVKKAFYDFTILKFLFCEKISRQPVGHVSLKVG